jgi:hypothetical protein
VHKYIYCTSVYGSTNKCINIYTVLQYMEVSMVICVGDENTTPWLPAAFDIPST